MDNTHYAFALTAAWVLISIGVGMLETASDYYFIEMIRANVSTHTLLMFRAIERAL